MPFATKKLMAAVSSAPAAIISFSGDQSTFSWATTDATAVSIDNGVGSVALSGSMANPYNRDPNNLPEHYMSWTLTASDGLITVTRSISVYYGRLLPWYCVHIPGHGNCQ